MVALNPNIHLKRAEGTAKLARIQLETDATNATALNAISDAARAMWHAMNAMLAVVGVPEDSAEVMSRISEDLVGKGVLSKDAYRLFLDAQAAKARFVYQQNHADPDDALRVLAWAGEFIEQTRKAIVERVPREEPIRRTAGVIGGKARVRNTRVPVWTLVQLKKLGRTDPDLLKDFPVLIPEDLDAVWDYYRQHTAEIEQDIATEAGED